MLSCQTILKNFKPRIYHTLDDRVGFCILCLMLDQILMGKIDSPVKQYVKNGCTPVPLIYQMRFYDLNYSLSNSFRSIDLAAKPNKR